MYERTGAKFCAFCYTQIHDGGIMAPITHMWFCCREHLREWLIEKQCERLEKSKARMERARHA